MAHESGTEVSHHREINLRSHRIGHTNVQTSDDSRCLPKAVVAFAGARDAYQLPLALSEAGLLERLVTDRYLPSWLSSPLQAIGRTELAAPDLPFSKIRVPSGALADFVAEKLGFGSTGGLVKGAAMGVEARAIARHHGAAVFSYSTSAFEALISPEIPHRLLFQYHPHPHSVKKILLEEIERTPWAAISLRAEPELSLSEEKFELLCEESKMATGIVAASTFTAETLVANGIESERIHLIPYGVNRAIFREKSLHASPLPLRIAFVGSMAQRKGISYLLEAIRLCASNQLQLVICTRSRPAAHWEDKLPANWETHVGLNRERMVRTLQTCHMLALPSLVEGFGHVILEGLSIGLPVIATPHTGGPDVLRDGSDGFIVPVRDSAAIAAKLEWALDNPVQLRDMAAQAIKTARRFSWELFRMRIVSAYRQMVANVDSKN